MTAAVDNDFRKIRRYDIPVINLLKSLFRCFICKNVVIATILLHITINKQCLSNVSVSVRSTI